MQKQRWTAGVQWAAAVVLTVAGIALLAAPGHAQTAAGFAPTRFTVTDSGTAGKPDVLLIPGLASSASVWDGEAKLLAPKYRLHTVQVAGFAGVPAGGNAGASDANPILPAIVEELHRYLAANKLRPAVIGHSLGGLLGLMLADKYPADVKSLVVVDALPFYALVFNPAATVEATKPMADGIGAHMLAMSDEAFATDEAQYVKAMVISADGQKAVSAAAVASDRKVFTQAMLEDLLTDLRPDIAAIKTPMLLVYPYDATAGVDAAAVEKVYTTAYAGKPNLTLVRIDGSRHFVMFDQPAKFDAEIQKWLAK